MADTRKWIVRCVIRGGDGCHDGHRGISDIGEHTMYLSRTHTGSGYTVGVEIPVSVLVTWHLAPKEVMATRFSYEELNNLGKMIDDLDEYYPADIRLIETVLVPMQEMT